LAQIAAPVGWVGSGSRRAKRPSTTVATVPQRAMQRLQYPCTCRTSAISADMNKLPRGRGHRVWPDYAQRNRRLPSQYQANAIRLSLDVRQCRPANCTTGCRFMSAATNGSSTIERRDDRPYSRPPACKCTSPNDRVAGAAGGPYAGTPFAPGPA
jgi:hypothetical protein